MTTTASSSASERQPTARQDNRSSSISGAEAAPVAALAFRTQALVLQRGRAGCMLTTMSRCRIERMEG